MNFRRASILGLGKGTTACEVVVLAALFSTRQTAHASRAIVRTYNLPCAPCHEAWPKRNNFDWTFPASMFGGATTCAPPDRTLVGMPRNVRAKKHAEVNQQTGA